MDPNGIFGGFSGITPEGLRVLQEHFVDLQSMEHIRHGGQGVVFRAVERNTGRTVAVKLLLNGPLATPHQRARFEREVELIGRLRHPNIVTLYGSGEVQGRLYFTMEFVDGHTIDDYALLHDLTPHEIVRLMIKVCRAINYSHQNGIIHRDLTPNNILVDAEGEPRIFDFGLAKDLHAENTSLTEHVVGTLPFMSPEQVGGLDGQVDTRADIYSLGLILYHLLTEGFPYPIEGSFDQIRGHLIATEPIPLRKAAGGARTDRIRNADQLTRDLEAILETALAKQKQDRYQTALALAEDLERYLAGEAVQARAKNKYYRIRKLIQRNWVAFSVAGAFALLLMISITAVTAAWVRTAAERDRANLGRMAAFNMFRTVIRDVERRVSRLPGGSGVTDSIIAGLEQELPSLAQLGDDQALVEFRAITLLRRGDLAEALGQRDQAGKSYREMFDLVMSAEPGAVRDAARLQAYGRLAPYADDPRRTFEDGIELAARMMKGGGHAEEVAVEAAGLELRYAEYLSQRELLRDALEHMRRAEGLFPPGDELASSVEWLLKRANRYSLLGNIQQRTDAPDEAVKSLRSAARLAQLALHRAPANTDAHVEVMRCCLRLGRCLRQQGDPAAAALYYAQAARQSDFLAEMDPSQAGWDHYRATIYAEAVGNNLNLPDRTVEDMLCTLSELAERAERQRPDETTTRWLRAWTDLMRGRWSSENGEAFTAISLFDNAIRTWERMLEYDPDNLGLKNDLAVSCFAMGAALAREGREREAAEWHRRHVEATCEVSRQNEQSVEPWLNFAEARYNLAQRLMRIAESGEADAAACRDATSADLAEAESLLLDVLEELDWMEADRLLDGWPDRARRLRLRITSMLAVVRGRAAANR